MTAVDLSFLPIVSAEPVPIENGRVLKPALNAPLQRIQRLGNKNSLVIQTGLISEGRQARFVRAKLAQARRDGALFPWPHDPDQYDIWCEPKIASDINAGSTLLVTGFNRSSYIRFGQPISVIVNGQRYLDFSEVERFADADGNMEIPIVNLIRTPIPAGSPVDIFGTMIEGTIEGFSGGTFGIDGTTSFTFTITEDA